MESEPITMCVHRLFIRYQYQLSKLLYRKITDPGDFLSDRVLLEEFAGIVPYSEEVLISPQYN